MLADLQAYIWSPARAEQERRETATATRKTPAGQGNAVGTARVRKPQKQPGGQYDTAGYRQAIEYATDAAFPVSTDLARHRGERLPDWRRRLGERWKDVLVWKRKHRWTPLQVRHALAEEVRERFGLEHTQGVLGHAHAKVTEVYAGVRL